MQTGSHLMGEVYFAFCKEVDTPVSLGCWLRFKYDQKSILEVDIDPRNYLEKDLQRFKGDYACVSLLSKWKGLKTGADLKAVGLSKFTTSEVHCHSTNQRIRESRNSPINGDFASILYRAKRKISRLLGPLTLSKTEAFFGWGPGATWDIPRRKAYVDTKMSTLPIAVSSRTLSLARKYIAADLHWSETILGLRPDGPYSLLSSVFKVVDSCRVDMVPKNAKTHRTIAIEPTLNLFFQKGVGGFIRQKLRRVGIDLDDQSTNQKYAAKAVETGLSTLDLSAASDSVSIELVFELLPVEWALFLDALRSHQALLPDGTLIELQKFSSMGNGFTFELETLIFWALGLSVLEHEEVSGGVLSVYGDDIIISRGSADLLIKILGFVGFSVNKEKSFVDGLFFESCGSHYFGGIDVTPFYQKEKLDKPEELVRFHNRIVRWSSRVGRSSSAQLPLYRHNHLDFRCCRIPLGSFGDDGYLVDIENVWDFRFHRNYGVRCRVFSPGAPQVVPGEPLVLLSEKLRKKGTGNLESSSWVRGDDVSIPSSSIRFGWRWIHPSGFSVTA
jgi:hypothetical protein